MKLTITKSEQKIAKAASKDTFRHNLCAVNADAKNNRLVATNGSIVGFRENVEVEETKLLELKPVQKKTPSNKETYNVEKEKAVSVYNLENSCHVVDATFPDVSSLEEEAKAGYEYSLTIDAGLLKTLCDALDANTSKGVSLLFNRNDKGKVDKAIKVETENKEAWGFIMPFSS